MKEQGNEPYIECSETVRRSEKVVTNPHRRGEIGRDETGVVRHRGGAIGAYNEAVKQAMASSRNGEQSQW